MGIKQRGVDHRAGEIWKQRSLAFGPPAPGHWSAAALRVSPQYGVTVPPSYWRFLQHFGPGTLSGFLHFHLPSHWNTFAERMAPFMDDELREAIGDDGDVLLFCDTDNGDSCGWHIRELVTHSDPPVWRFAPRSFDAQLLATSFDDLFDKLMRRDNLFGGPLEFTYQPADPGTD